MQNRTIISVVDTNITKLCTCEIGNNMMKHEQSKNTMKLRSAHLYIKVFTGNENCRLALHNNAITTKNLKRIFKRNTHSG